MNDNKDYSVTFLVDQTPEDVYAAINNVRGWWSEQIDGDTDQLGTFEYHYKDVHRCTIEVTQLEPGRKVMWHVADNHFNFIADQNEWVNTDIVFDITRQGDQTEVRFTHVGLVPAYECYDVCSNAWGSYISSSLRNLISTGKGHPNPIEEVVNQALQMSQQNYTTSFTVDQSPSDVFAAVNNVRGWWSEAIEGSTDQLGAEFEIRFGDVHRSTQRIAESVPGERVVWHVTDSQLNFLEDKREWTGTDIVFEIARVNDRTELRFTHIGLVPAIECYSVCSDTWGIYINHSLFTLITTGEGKPGQKETAAQAVEQ